MSNGNSNSLNRAEQGSAVISFSATRDEAAVIHHDIVSLTSQLSKMVNDMQQTAITMPQKAVVQRYLTILQDWQSDIDKTVARVKQAADRHELLSGSNSDNGMNVQDPAMDHLLRERNHINGSMRAADSVLGQAGQIHSDLRGQGRSLRTSGSVLAQLGQKVPGLNHLVEQIRRKRSRDDYIVAGVISSCVLFTLWYIFG